MRWSSQESVGWLETHSYADFSAFDADREAVSRRFHSHHEQQVSLLDGDTDVKLSGSCYCCSRPSTFHSNRPESEDGKLGEPNWRESLLCKRCGLISRIRASIQVFEQRCMPSRLSRIYATEYTTPFFRWLKRRYPRAIGSEFTDVRTPLPKASLAWFWHRSCLQEDVTELSFPDQHVHHVLSFEVLEHIADWERAVDEFFRVMKPGGWLVLTTPFLEHARQTLVRARVRPDGSIEHLLEPEYHGDPINDAGCLCYYHFGWDLLDRLREAGFTDVNGVYYWAMKLAYLGNQFLILARKPV